MVNMTDVSNDEQKPSGEDATKPPGAAFKITLAGRDIWFAKMLDSQHIALSRIQRRTGREIEAIFRSEAARDDKTVAASNLIDGMYQKMWDAIDSTIISDADRDFLETAMLTAKLQMSDAMRVFRQGKDEPQPDDAEIEAKPRTPRAPRKAVAAKKATPAKKAGVANARRVQK